MNTKMRELAPLILSKLESGELNVNPLFDSWFNKKGNTDINVLINNIKYYFRQKPKSSPLKLLKILNLEPNDILNIQEVFPTIYNIFGCDTSTDVDVAVLIDDPNIINLFKKGMVVINLDAIKKDIDTTKELDINFVTVVKDGSIGITSKGGRETQNIIYYTYDYHPQKFPKIFNKPIDVDLNDKIRGLCKYVLDHMEHLLGKEKYKQERQHKIEIYDSSFERMDYINALIKSIKLPINKSIIKAIVMKLIQIILLDNNEVAYTKKLLVEKINDIFPGHSNQFWNLLTRTVCHPDIDIPILQKTFDLLIVKYLEIYDNLTKKYIWKNINIDWSTNPTCLPDDLIAEFINSPVCLTQKFSDLATKFDPHFFGIVNKHFILKSKNTDILPTELKPLVIIEEQRSEKWLELMSYYTCGGTTNSICESQSNYNLIRGAIGEIFVVNNSSFKDIFDFDVEKCMVGLLVEDVTKGSVGCAPDLLLVKSDGHIIPVEIKCFAMPKTFDISNKNFYRGFKLAKKQLERTNQILSKHLGKSLDIGVVIFAFFQEGIIETFYTVVDL